MFYRLIVMAAFVASAAMAQISDYLGPSIMSRGASDVGTRSGATVDLRFFANVSDVYDTGLVPLATNTAGQLVDTGAVDGVEAQVGAYGTHNWRTSRLSLDYNGTYRYYNNASYFDGSDQQLLLGYTYQKSRRLRFDFKEQAGTYSQAFGSVFTQGPTEVTGGLTPNNALLFDNRSTFLQTGMDVTYILSARNNFSAGGEGYDVMRQSKALVGMHGYTLHGNFEHKLSQYSSIAVTYSHYHYDFPNAFGESNIDSFQAGYSRKFDRNRWTFRIFAGALQAETTGLQVVNLDPLIASILGVPTTVQAYYQKSILPSGNASLTRRFKSSNLSFSYSTGTSPGNGVYLTSRQSNGGASFSYTGVRKTSLTLDGNYNSYASLGQSLAPYHSYGAGFSASYALTHALHLTARYDSRHQEIDQSVFRKESYRVSVGVAFSPGDIPLSIF